jgi:hypothetical protein
MKYMLRHIKKKGVVGFDLRTRERFLSNELENLVDRIQSYSYFSYE